MARPKKQAAPAGNMVIENTKPCAMFIPGAGAFGRQQLMPGQNDVDAAHWDAVKDNPAVHIWTSMGLLQCHGHGKAEPMARGLDGRSDAEVAEQLAKLSDVAMITELRDVTASGALRELCQQRIKALLEGDYDIVEAPDHPER